MNLTEVAHNNPIPTEKSVRGEEVRVLTSCRAGKLVPVSYIPVLREDRVSRGNIKLRFEMAETIHPLMNAVNVSAYVHFVPFLAMAKSDGTPMFLGMDEFNRAYTKTKEASGSQLPFFMNQVLGGPDTNPVLRTMGIHRAVGVQTNLAVHQAYLAVANFRRRMRSKHLPEISYGSWHASGGALLSAFWKNTNFAHIVPDFDAAMIDGEVPLSWTNATLTPNGAAGSVSVSGFSKVNPTVVTTGTHAANIEHVVSNGSYTVKSASNGTGFTIDNLSVSRSAMIQGITFELANEGVALSLANIDLAKKTAAFAKLRGQFAHLSEDHLIDLLMEGVRVPDEQLKQPILLDKKSTIFGYTERHATDGDNLDKSVTTGVTELSLNFRTPAMNTGGIILVTVEIVPEQLWERQDDVFLRTTDPEKLPNFLRDYLDPEKVDVVRNDFVDVHHSQPSGTFGYAPLNHEWKRSITRVGGKYYRPKTAGFVEDRQRFWSVEKTDPKLTEDFYMVGDLPHSVFADTTADPFEILALGNVQIVGNTVFGGGLEENRGDYAAVMEEVDTQRIVQP